MKVLVINCGSSSIKYKLYNMETDLGETRNVYSNNPDIVQQLERQLIELVKRGRSNPGPDLKNDYEKINIYKNQKNFEKK